jgi:hypothetical protein
MFLKTLSFEGTSWQFFGVLFCCGCSSIVS